jgi:Domain of unknown function (DUF5911)
MTTTRTELIQAAKLSNWRGPPHFIRLELTENVTNPAQISGAQGVDPDFASCPGAEQRKPMIRRFAPARAGVYRGGCRRTAPAVQQMPGRIEDYAIIGNCESAAMVGLDGSIDWLTLPRFDSAACFAALLGGPENGRWRVAPVSDLVQVSRRYREGTECRHCRVGPIRALR